MCKSKKAKKDKSFEKEQARKAAAVKKGMMGIDAQFSQFDDKFYDGRRQAYLDFANPQLDEQYQDAYKKLIFALSRSNSLNSSAGVEEMARLSKQRDDRKQEIMDAARAAANQARSDVANQRSELVAQLNSTYDPDATGQAAMQRSALLAQAPAFSSLGDLFTLPAALGAQAITEARSQPTRSGATLFQNPTAGSPIRSVG